MICEFCVKAVDSQFDALRIYAVYRDPKFVSTTKSEILLQSISVEHVARNTHASPKLGKVVPMRLRCRSQNTKRSKRFC